LEPFTHALTSLTISRAIQSRLPRFGAALLITAGTAPDLDYASYFGGPSAFLTLHRSALHSIAGAIVTSCALTALFCALDKKWLPREQNRNQTAPLRPASAFALCTIGIIGHQLLDIASGDGIQLLWPFRAHWSRWNLAANFDVWVLFFLLGAWLIPQLLRLVSEEVGAPKKAATGSVTALATLLLLATYFGGRAYLHGRAVEMLLSSEYHGREPLSAGAFPSTANLLDWLGEVSTDDTLEELDVNLSPGADFGPDRSLTYYKPAESPALEAGEKTEVARKFLKYAQFPLASVARREEGYRFELRDLRYQAGNDTPANMIVRVDFTSTLQIIREDIRYASSGEN
jgi:membrane-bound metal-dependent hydrolase YbcI (DUF457 family)